MRWRRAGSTCRSCRSTTSAGSGSTSARSISQVESTYMVTAASGIKTVDEVDRPASASSASPTPRRSAPPGRTLKNTTVNAAQSIGEAIAMMTRRQGRRLRAVARLAAAVRGASCPARASSRAASSSPASPSRWRRAGRRRWRVSRRSWTRRRSPARCKRAFERAGLSHLDGRAVIRGLILSELPAGASRRMATDSVSRARSFETRSLSRCALRMRRMRVVSDCPAARSSAPRC